MHATDEKDDDEQSESEASEINDTDEETEEILGTKRRIAETDYKHVGFAALPAESALESWQAFFTDETLGTVVESTNKQLVSKKSDFSRDRDCKYTDLSEIKSFIGLLYLAGYYRSSRLNAKDLWSGDGSGVELFRLVMSRNRFFTLLSNLCFDDRSTRKERLAFDRLAAVRHVFDMFVRGCRTSYVPGQFVTAGETFVKFQGKCDFRQSVPGEPGRFGIKIFSLVDAGAFYTVNLEIDPVMQPAGPFEQSYEPGEVVKRLCRPIFGTGRTVTSDACFTSCSTPMALLRENVTCMGAVEKTDEIPPDFATLVRKKGIVLSTMHETPEILTLYDRTKSAVAVVAKLSATYSVRKKTNRWTMSVFYSLLNVAAINAHVLSGSKDRRRFLRTLVMELVSEQLRHRSHQQCLPRDIRQRSAEVSGRAKPEACPDERKKETPDGGRKRCYLCDRKKNRKTKYTCMKCERFICLEHANYVCDVCKAYEM